MLYANDTYELILVFCDTDKEPYREYAQIKKKINQFLSKTKAEYAQIKKKINQFLSKTKVSDKLIIFANPCTMQIILSHFGDVSLKNQGKKTNASVIEQYTGVSDYDAHDDQIKNICKQIYKRTYPDMKRRVETINLPDTISGSTNFFLFLERFENDNTNWISEINRYIKN